MKNIKLKILIQGVFEIRVLILTSGLERAKSWNFSL
jgi:hypothetical protein